MCEKVSQVWNVFYLTISPVMFSLEKDTNRVSVDAATADPEALATQ